MRNKYTFAIVQLWKWMLLKDYFCYKLCGIINKHEWWVVELFSKLHWPNRIPCSEDFTYSFVRYLHSCVYHIDLETFPFSNIIRYISLLCLVSSSILRSWYISAGMKNTLELNSLIVTYITELLSAVNLNFFLSNCFTSTFQLYNIEISANKLGINIKQGLHQKVIVFNKKITMYICFYLRFVKWMSISV